MFKQAKRKIVRSIMLILAAILVATLALIYVTSYVSVMENNYSELKQCAANLTAKQEEAAQASDQQDEAKQQTKTDQQDESNQQKHGDQGKHGKGKNGSKTAVFGVEVYSDGSASVIKNKENDLYSDEELIEAAKTASAGLSADATIGTTQRGRTGDLLYFAEVKEQMTLVVLMDNTGYKESFSSLFRSTLVFGLIAMIVLYFVARKIAERIVEPMEQSYERQKQFTSDASHELKTPIASISANAELLRREIGENKWLDNIAAENNQMKELVTELLDLAKNENTALPKEEVDLSHLVTGVILPMEAAAFEKGIELKSEIEEEIRIEGNAPQLERLVTILVDNALSHASGEAKEVTVSLKLQKNTAVLTVSNPGDPIREEEKEKLFERFYRSDEAHAFTGHYGLGLAIAKSIANAHEGSIDVSCADGLVSFIVRIGVL